MTRTYLKIIGLTLLAVLGLGACSSPSDDPVSPCDASVTTQCLTSYDDWAWTHGIARSVRF